MEKTLGEQRVRTDFNVAGSANVDKIKHLSAQLINLINDLPTPQVDNAPANLSGEFARCKAKALTEIEDGAMWGVKAATYGL